MKIPFVTSQQERAKADFQTSAEEDNDCCEDQFYFKELAIHQSSRIKEFGPDSDPN